MPNEAQMRYMFDKVGYHPTQAQWPIHLCTARIRQVAGGERSGKSHSSEKDLLTRLFEGTLFWLVAADYERTRAEYNYLCEDLAKLGVSFTATKQVDPGEILIEGGIRVNTKSAKDPRKLAMEAPDGILVCEASQIDYETYLRLRGRLAEKRGWMLMSGTFESSLGWYVDMYQLGQTPSAGDFKSFSLPTWSNTVIFPEGRNDPEILSLEAAYSTEWFMERFGGIPSPPKGLVITEFRNHIHTGSGQEYEYDPTLPVQLWIDPGYQHHYAVEAVQRKGEDIYIIGEVYETGLVTSDIITVCQKKDWWPNVSGGAIDIAALQHQAMPAPVEIWVKETGIFLRSQKVRIIDGIERMKSCLKVNPITNRPSLFINTRCKGLISELGGCPQPVTGRTAVYKWRMDNEGNVIGDKPEDKNNDAIKAVVYGLVDMIGYSPGQRKATIKFF